MAFCSKCGKELRNNVKFCTGCGAKVIVDTDVTEQGGGNSESAGASGSDTARTSANAPNAQNAGYGGGSDQNYAEYTTNESSADNTANTGGSTPPPQNEPDTRPLAPTIVIAPPPKKDNKRFAKTAAKAAIGGVLLVIVIIAGVWITAWLMSNPFRSSPVEEVDNEKYTRMLALVEDVRNPNFDEVIDDLLVKKGKAEDYSFLQEYTDKFNEILGDEYTDEEKLFCDCCYFVWYTEYMAKRYEWLSKNSGLLNSLYTGKANTYRSYADTLYDMLCNSDSVTDLNNIKIYCADHEIITDK